MHVNRAEEVAHERAAYQEVGASVRAVPIWNWKLNVVDVTFSGILVCRDIW